MALKNDDNLVSLVVDTSTAMDVLIAVEYELAMRCQPSQPMTIRLEKFADMLKARCLEKFADMLKARLNIQ